MNREGGKVYSVCILQFFVLLSTTICSLNKNKQIVNIGDEILSDYSFLSRYHYNKSKNYLKKTISNSSLNSHVYWDTLYIKRISMKSWRPALSIQKIVEGSLFQIFQIQIQGESKGIETITYKNPLMFRGPKN